MKKSDLKTLIKPLVKECIHEVLIEEGLLSNVVSEVAKGMQGNLVTESAHTPSRPTSSQKSVRSNTKKLHEQRKKMMDAIGHDAYNGAGYGCGADSSWAFADWVSLDVLYGRIICRMLCNC